MVIALNLYNFLHLCILHLVSPTVWHTILAHGRDSKKARFLSFKMAVRDSLVRKFGQKMSLSHGKDLGEKDEAASCFILLEDQTSPFGPCSSQHFISTS